MDSIKNNALNGHCPFSHSPKDVATMAPLALVIMIPRSINLARFLEAIAIIESWQNDTKRARGLIDSRCSDGMMNR